MGPSQGSQIGKDETPTTETTERSVSNSHSNGGGWNTFLISFHRFRYDNHVRLQHPQSGPAHHDTPRRAPIGGPSSPGSPVPFSHPARNAMSRTHNTHLAQHKTHTHKHTQGPHHQVNPPNTMPTRARVAHRARWVSHPQSKPTQP